MEAAQYDQWYETGHGRWIGQREARLLRAALAPRPGESLLDVGCGTGYFTRALSETFSGDKLGVDIDPQWVDYASRRESGSAAYAVADARALPCADNGFDVVVCIAALGFIREEKRAIAEIVRVARRRFALGLLNRHSLLYLLKGRGGGKGGYQGGHWHTAAEAKALLCEFPVHNLQIRTAIHLPRGGVVARAIERVLPPSLHSGAFLLVTGDVAAD